MPRPTVPPPPEDLLPALRALYTQIAEGLADPKLGDWRKPWLSYGAHRGVGGRVYGLGNQIRVFHHALGHGHTAELWLSRTRGERMYGKLREGAVPVTIYMPNPPFRRVAAQQKTPDGQEEAPEPAEDRPRATWRFEGYPVSVYNVECFSRAPERRFEARDAAHATARVAHLFAGAGARLAVASQPGFDQGASYHLIEDRVRLPHPDAFVSPAAHASTALHELVHWTGAFTRLARHAEERRIRDEQDYAFEELVAEIGAMTLCARLGVEAAAEPDPQHLAYLRHWFARSGDVGALWEALVLGDQAVRLLERLAPDAFAEEPPSPLPLASSEPDFSWEAAWGASVPGRPEDLGAEAPELVLHGLHLPALQAAWEALVAWAAAPPGSEPGPVLTIMGRPEDGPETLLRWLTAHLEGDAPLALVGLGPGEYRDLRTLLASPGPWQVTDAEHAKEMPFSARWFLAWERGRTDARLGPTVAPRHAVRSAALATSGSLPHPSDQPMVPWCFVQRPGARLPELTGRAHHRVDLRAAPLGASAVAWALQGTDVRPAKVAAFRADAYARELTDLNRHSRTDSRHAAPRPYAPLEATLPFLPVTLAVAQAWLDRAAARGARPRSLPLRLLIARRIHNLSAERGQIVPLSELLPLAEADPTFSAKLARYGVDGDDLDLLTAARALEQLDDWRVGPKSMGALSARWLEAPDADRFWERVAGLGPWLRMAGGGVRTRAT